MYPPIEKPYTNILSHVLGVCQSLGQTASRDWSARTRPMFLNNVSSFLIINVLIEKAVVG